MSDMISISALDKIIKEATTETAESDFYGNKLVVKTTLPFADMVRFVNEVVDNCFSDSGEYLPEVKKFIIDINIVQYYSNVRLPDDVKHKYDIIIKTGIADVVRQYVDDDQFASIMRAIDDKIRSRVHTNEQLFENRLSVAMHTIESLIQNVKTSFEGISPEDVKNMLNAISDGKFDEEKLVSAYLNAKEDGTKSTESTEREPLAAGHYEAVAVSSDT